MIPIWIALIGLKAFLVFCLLAFLLTLLQTEDLWSVTASWRPLPVCASLFSEPFRVFTLLDFVLIAWTHRHDLVRLPCLCAWVANISQERQA